MWTAKAACRTEERVGSSRGKMGVLYTFFCLNTSAWDMHLSFNRKNLSRVYDRQCSRHFGKY